VHANPDIVVNAKLLTGGLLPLCTTTASNSVFEAFVGDDKATALLHGHSYTAHAVGCSVGVEALKSLKMAPKLAVGDSVWDPHVVKEISGMESVEGVVALGTVLAVTMKDGSGGGYASSAAEGVKRKLLDGGDGLLVHSRVLGNVIYFITGLKTKPEGVRDVEKKLVKTLKG
jgi:bifunctional dethiobiotin synthetase / adenosylmethionine---8-amino-7-oxononanoate aminotransferase